MNEQEIKHINEQFPKGTKIKLNHMFDDVHPVPDGTKGIVEYVDDAGQIHVKWENGSSLALISNEDEFEKIQEDLKEIVNDRKVTYYRDFAFDENDKTYESSVDDLRKEVEKIWFYHAQNNADGLDEESYNNFIEWTKMVVEIHDMSEDEFVEKILKGHVGYPSVEDIGYKYITDTFSHFKCNVINRLLDEARNINHQSNKDTVYLCNLIDCCKELIKLDDKGFLNIYSDVSTSHNSITVDDFCDAMRNNSKSIQDIQKEENRYDIKVEFWNEYNKSFETIPISDFKTKLIDEYLEFTLNQISECMRLDESKYYEAWLNKSLHTLEMDEHEFIQSLKDNTYENDQLTVTKIITNKNIPNIIDDEAYLTSRMLGDCYEQNEDEEHNNEIAEFNDLLFYKIPDYKCYIFPKYTDLGHKNKIIDGYTDNLHSAIEHICDDADIHSGIDVKFNKDKDLVVVCYGSMYKYKEDDVTLEKITEYKIVPVNDENECVDLYNEVFNAHNEQQEQTEEIEDFQQL